MSLQKRIHVHLGGHEEAHSCELNEPKTVEALLVLLIETGKFGSVVLEEIILFEEDSDEALPRDHCITSEHHGKHFHASRCHQIKTTIVHVDEKHEHAFPPGITVGKLLHWAIEKFKVDKSGKYALRLATNSDPLAHAVHLGSLVHGHPCAVTLYFTPTSRIQG